MNIPHISIVSPVYGCKTCIYELYFRLKETIEKSGAALHCIKIEETENNSIEYYG